MSTWCGVRAAASEQRVLRPVAVAARPGRAVVVEIGGREFLLGRQEARTLATELNRAAGADCAEMVVLERVEEMTGVSVGEQLSQARTWPVVRARFLAMWGVMELWHPTRVALGAMFGRDHGTVTHGLKRAAELMETEKEFARQAQALVRLGRPAAVALQQLIAAQGERAKVICGLWGGEPDKPVQDKPVQEEASTAGKGCESAEALKVLESLRGRSFSSTDLQARVDGGSAQASAWLTGWYQRKWITSCVVREFRVVKEEA